MLSTVSMSLHGQRWKPDSLQLEAGQLSVLNGQVAPFWLRSQQNGIVDFTGNQALMFAELKAEKNMRKHELQVLASPHLSLNGKLRFRELQFSYRFRNLGLLIGKAPTHFEFGNNSLSTGSFGLSHNALPIPGIQAGFMKYTPVPFTKGWVQIRGWMKHGYFRDDRYTINPLLHEKHGALKIGKPQFSVSSSIYHYAIWNGEHPEKGLFPRRNRDFWRVFRGKNADYDYWRSYDFRNEFNALGSHIGNGNIVISSSLGKHKMHLRFEKVAEDGSGLSQRNRDHKWSAGWSYGTKERRLELVFETFKTDVQSGPGIPDSTKVYNFGYLYGGRDDYYNNGNYRSGWTHHGNIIGTPLFMTKPEADEVFNTSINDYDRIIVNNRVQGWHMAAKLTWTPKMHFTAQYTRTKNLGTYAGLNGGRYQWGSRDDSWSDPDYPFNEPLIQNYTALGIKYTFVKATIDIGLAYDFGQMYHNAGILFKYSHQLF